MLNYRVCLDLFNCVQCDHRDLLRQRQGVRGRGHMTVEQGMCVHLRVCVVRGKGHVTVDLCGSVERGSRSIGGGGLYRWKTRS